ncbi:MAG: hypothetical protein JO306_05000 [Gemmatimonadetes bacterium]|nr:hypothetical protein [Gemmatimonadota bacterium]
MSINGERVWTHTHDVGRALRGLVEGHLPRPHQMKLVERVNLSAHGRAGRHWVYRITEAGGRASAETWGDAYEPVRVPGELEYPKPVYLRSEDDGDPGGSE